MNHIARILIVDDDAKTRDLLTLALGKEGYETEAAATGREALKRARERAFNVALLDIMLPDLLGVDLLSPLKAMHPDMAAVMITAHASTETAVQALNEGASAYITKPLKIKDVVSTVRAVLDEQNQRKRERRVLEELRRYAEELEARNEELDAFAHTVAHDLKSPSYKISGYAETLLQDEYGPLPPDVQKECLRIMAQGARQVSTLVDELLTLAQVRSEDMETRPLVMGEIVARARRRLAFVIENRGAKLIVPKGWPTALGHAAWVEEVWVNYISNAIKYGGRPDEGIPPIVELGHGPSPLDRPEPPPDSSHSCYLSVRDHRFWVQDNGRGLTSEEQARLFTPFTRLEQVDTKGHGLGLSVVRRIVEKLGGEVGVESRSGEGSLFSFTLPRGDA